MAWLTYAALAVAVALLLGVVFVLMSGGLAGDQAPRTFAESQIADAKAQTVADPSNMEAWQAYARALIFAEDYSEAKRVLEQARENLAEGKSPARLMLVETELLMAQNKYDEALAMTGALLEEYPRYKDEMTIVLEEADIGAAGAEAIGAGEGFLLETYVLRARVQDAMGGWQGVIEATTKALELDPNAADVLTLRGNAYVKIGDLEAARADYERAAAFQYEPAVQALENLGR